MRHWLIKSEPDVFSIADLARARGRTTSWDGVRNYQARNFLRAMRRGDCCLFYHSNADPPAVAGVVEVVREAYPDPSAWDPRSPGHDPKAAPDNPVWSMVDVKLVEVFPREVPLDELRGVKTLAGMELLRRGSRLSVQPVTAGQFSTITRLAARQRRDGLTLVELLVVMAVVGVLIGLLVPAVQRARESARRAGCGNHLRQVGLAVATYETAGRFLPPGRTSQGSRGHSWAFSLLPFVDERPVFDALVATLPVHDDSNATAMRTPVPVFFCPSRRGPVADRNFDNNGEPPLVTGAAAAGDFAAVAGAQLTYASVGGSCDPLLAGPIHTTSRVRLAQVTDGASRTLAVGERHLPPVDPAWPADLVHLHQGDTAFFSADTPTTLFREPTDGLGLGADDRAVGKFGGPHPGLTQFVFLDGHVDALAADVDRQVLRWLCTIGDGHDTSATPAGGEF